MVSIQERFLFNSGLWWLAYGTLRKQVFFYSFSILMVFWSYRLGTIRVDVVISYICFHWHCGGIRDDLSLLWLKVMVEGLQCGGCRWIQVYIRIMFLVLVNDPVFVYAWIYILCGCLNVAQKLLKIDDDDRPRCAIILSFSHPTYVACCWLGCRPMMKPRAYLLVRKRKGV